ncbi:reticulon-4 receptor isoform 1-T1 [Xenentodon cancila]
MHNPATATGVNQVFLNIHKHNKGITEDPTRLLQQGGRLLFLVMWLNLVPQTESCPAKCVCYSEPRPTVACQQQGLFFIPTEIPVRSQRIFLQSNKLTVVRSTSFSSCHNLTVLWLYSNNISYIEAGAFYGLEKLEELDIGDNSNLRTISPTAFRGLTKLHTLHLHRCGLSELPVGVFRGMLSLQYLYLQDNNILTLHDDTFLDLANLTYLYLHNNKIKIVTDNMFRGLINLDRLLLHQNRVIYVQPRAFSDLGKLKSLFLFLNNITVLTGETMDPLVSLQYLRLNGNQWICDCRARSLWEWFKRFKGSSSELECHVPDFLAGKDLKRLKNDNLEGCVETPQIQTNLFSSKAQSGKFPPTESPLGKVIPMCCLGDNDKSSILSGKSRQITNNPLKEKENMSKTKYKQQERTKNETQIKQNDGPLGTLSNTLEKTLENLNPDFIDNPESSTTPNKKKKKCSKKPRSDNQCIKSQGSTLQVLRCLIIPIIWISLAMS